MKQPPFYKNDSDRLWAYLDGSLSEKETTELEMDLENSEDLRASLEQCEKLTGTFDNYQQQTVPNWNPEAMFRSPGRAPTTNWYSMAIAATALIVSLLPYVHINESSISFGSNTRYVSEQQLQQTFVDYDSQQKVSFNEKLDQLQTDQNSKNQALVVSLLDYAEKRRRNDLLQMASWFSRQTELNQNQQRQIINWVVNEQQQDQQAISTLFNSINDEAYPVSNEDQP